VSGQLPAVLLSGKEPPYPLDRKLGGLQSQSGGRGEEKNLAPTGTRTPTTRPSSPQPVAIPTVLSTTTTISEGSACSNEKRVLQNVQHVQIMSFHLPSVTHKTEHAAAASSSRTLRLLAMVRWVSLPRAGQAPDFKSVRLAAAFVCSHPLGIPAIRHADDDPCFRYAYQLLKIERKRLDLIVILQVLKL
jgi:hypothetical protein